MNQIVVIGNGFDLSHGLKTRYLDFMLWYLNYVVQSLVTNFKFEDTLIKASMQYRTELPKEFNSLKDFQDFRNLHKRISFEIKYDFMSRLLNQYGSPNWIDIESKYYESLISIYKEWKKEIPESFGYLLKELKDLNKCFNLIKERLVEYLLIIESEEVNLQEDIHNHLERNVFTKKNVSYKTLFLNFNYTSTIENYLQTINGREFEVNYIHGKLNDNNNPIIFGYGDEIDSYYQEIERLNENEFLQNIKSFGYFRTNNYQNFSRFLEQGKFQVHIMGHSCGLSDRILINSLVENKYCFRIKIYYYLRTKHENDYTEKTHELSRHFSATGKSRMRNIIIPECDSVPLIKYNK